MASGFVRKSDKGELSTCRHGHPQVTSRLLHKSTLLSVLDLFFGNGRMEWNLLNQTRNVRSVTKFHQKSISVFGIY